MGAQATVRERRRKNDLLLVPLLSSVDAVVENNGDFDPFFFPFWQDSYGESFEVGVLSCKVLGKTNK